MSSREQSRELMRSCLDGDASPQDFEKMELLLKQDPEFRREYIRYLNIDLALSESVRSPALEIAAKTVAGSSRRFLIGSSWSAAAAGLFLGLFCASVAWSMVAPRGNEIRLEIPLLEFEFEDPEMSWDAGFPVIAGQWNGDPGAVVESEMSLEGSCILRLEPSSESSLSYVQQIIDVESLGVAKVGELRLIEVVSSFRPETIGYQDRYTVRVGTFSELPREVRAVWEGVSWRELDERSLTNVKSGLTTQVDDLGWQTIGATIEVPEGARSIVVSIAAGRFKPDEIKGRYFVDGLRAGLLFTPPRERSRKQRK